MDSELRVPPHNIEAEEGLLACCLLEESSKEVVGHCIEAKITPDSFFKEAHRAIFETLRDIYDEGGDVHEISLFDRLQKDGKDEESGGLEQIYRIQGRVDTSSHYKYFAKIVKEKWVARRIIRVARETIEASYEKKEDPITLVSRAEQQFRDLSNQSDSGEAVRDADSVVSDEVRKLKNKINDPDANKEFVVRTHLRDLNGMFFEEGFTAPEMVVIGARPSVGKSALMSNFIEQASVEDKKHTLTFSYEMEAGQIVNRIAASNARVPAKKIKRPHELSSYEQQELAKAYKNVGASPIYINDDSSNTILDIRAKALRKNMQLQRKGERLAMVCIDYLQLIPPTDRRIPRREQVAEISRGTKQLAKELRCPVVVLSQLNRESEKTEGRPKKSELREAGDIEQDADVVILLHQPSNSRDDDPDESINPDVVRVELIIDKQRDGECGIVDTTFIKKYTRFENFAR